MLTKEEFARAVSGHKDTVFRIAFSYMKNPHDADDITQTVFLKLWNSRITFENDRHLRNWLIRVAINECRSIFRGPWRRMENINDYAEQLAMPTPKHTELFSLVMAMPEKYRTILYLFYYEGYSAEEIGAFLRIPAATVRTRLVRGRKQLKKIVTEGSDDD